MYGHVAQLAEAVKSGIESAGGHSPTIYQIEETLSDEELGRMYAPPKPAYPIIYPEQLPEFDAFMLGIPTRFGNFPGQWKVFWDKTGQLWRVGALHGKIVGLFFSTATLGGGQESTALAIMSTLAHHGMVYVPLGYKFAPQLADVSEVHGGGPWGAGTIAGDDSSRQPSRLEREIAAIQGRGFYEFVKKIQFRED
ncbi:Flavodoxin/nitric oxide synthase [Penicillium occitanis (nom. inval.)]|nr:Flavodoxin/nitric oxide synthase [Penicillium occitanis (nom. inval.)]PCG98145.1 hypothetical protein PENOC_064660 [Penicillium occitanis (nom. inval.)]